jgi:hypothetical protein
VFSTTNPASGRWNISATLVFVAVGAYGDIETSTNPAAGTWTASRIEGGDWLFSVSCPSTSLCMAIAASDPIAATGNIAITTDPAAGGSAWTFSPIDTNSPCPAPSSCTVEEIQASGATGLHVLDSANDTGTGTILSHLKLTGNAVTWEHNGVRRSATLTP